ncbi:MAG: hypothetical protein K8I27_16820 [Planctomycetes bacterium]|nr:hypothetical protein [Planctomycetota bacterium]
MKYATALVLVLGLLLTGGCGNGDYQAPPRANGLAPHNGQSGGGGTGGTKKERTGPSFSKEYEPEAKAALSAWDTWASDKTPGNFAQCGAHLYNAMRYKILTERNGHSTGNFYKAREVGRLFTDWKKTFQTGDWESNAEYKAAKAAYNEIQQ